MGLQQCRRPDLDVLVVSHSDQSAGKHRLVPPFSGHQQVGTAHGSGGQMESIHRPKPQPIRLLSCQPPEARTAFYNLCPREKLVVEGAFLERSEESCLRTNLQHQVLAGYKTQILPHEQQYGVRAPTGCRTNQQIGINKDLQPKRRKWTSWHTSSSVSSCPYCCRKASAEASKSAFISRSISGSNSTFGGALDRRRLFGWLTMHTSSLSIIVSSWSSDQRRAENSIIPFRYISDRWSP